MKNKKQRQESFLLLIALVQNKFSMSSNKPTGCGMILNSMSTDCQICEKLDTEVFEFSFHRDVNEDFIRVSISYVNVCKVD